MKQIIMDSGPIISLSLNNNLLWLLERTSEIYKIQFFITGAVKKEIIDNPLETKKFKFEALHILNLIKKGVIHIISDERIIDKTRQLLDIANMCFKARGKNLNLVHFAEMSAVAAFLLNKSDAVMIDERTTRYLIERPEKLKHILSHKLHTKVEIDKKQIRLLKKETKKVKFIRSAEFVAVCYEKGLLDEFLPERSDADKVLIEALLWGIKLNGCAISTRDLETLQRESLKVR